MSTIELSAVEPFTRIKAHFTLTGDRNVLVRCMCAIQSISIYEALAQLSESEMDLCSGICTRSRLQIAEAVVLLQARC